MRTIHGNACRKVAWFIAATCAFAIGASSQTGLAQGDDTREGRLEKRADRMEKRISKGLKRARGLEQVDVKVEEGTVTLTGTVPDQASRQQAERLATQMGARQVDNQIQIIGQPGQEPDDRGVQRGQNGDRGDGVRGEVSDSWITTKIKAQYVGKDVLEGADISVDTENAVVTLTGTVPSEAAKKHAEQIALTTKGVVRVDNQLRVEPGDRRPNQRR
jgi:osmotically-inducible protein OsmY